MKATQFFANTLLKKYNPSGFRYTSYPTTLAFHEQFKHEQ
jgi:hypothetical protein